MRLCRAFALVGLLSANAAAAEPSASLSITSRTGLVRAPFVTEAFPEVSGFATVLTPAAALRLSSSGWLRAQLPITYVRLDYPAGAQVGEVALGNLELAFERPLRLGAATNAGLLVAVLAPTADQGPSHSLLNNRALVLGSALDGHKDQRLFAPGVMGLRLGASIERSQGPFQFHADLGVPIVLRLSRASLPEETETHTAGIAPTLGLQAAWWLKPWFAAALGGSVVLDLVRIQEPTRRGDRNQRLQPILEPGLRFRLGRRVRLGLDASIPVAGALGGEAWSIAPSARFDL